jgi:broad specificity phosphatase PhoE
MTEEQVREIRPGWNLWRDGVAPGDVRHPGETLQQVAARTDAVLGRVRRCTRLAQLGSGRPDVRGLIVGLGQARG